MKPTTTKKPAPETTPSFPGVPAATLKSLATKIRKLDDKNKIWSALYKTAEDATKELGWHLATSGLVDLADHNALIDFLSDGLEQMTDVQAIYIAEMLARRKGPLESWRKALLPEWTTFLDDLVFRAYPRAREAFAEAAPSYSDAMKLGLAFVQRRHGDPIDAKVGRAIVNALAEAQSGEGGLLSNAPMPFVDDAGTLRENPTVDLDALKAVALRFGTEREWDAALMQGAKRNRWRYLREVASAFSRMPFDDLVAMIAARSSYDIFPGSEFGCMPELLRARADSPQELWTASARFAEKGLGSMVVELFAAVGLVRAVERGDAIPTNIEERFTCLDLLRDEQTQPLMIEALRALPAEHVWKLVRTMSPHYSLAALAAHFDAALFEEMLALDERIDAKLLGAIGPPAIPALIRALDHGSEELRRERFRALLLCMWTVVRAGGAADESWDTALRLPLWPKRNGTFDPIEQVLEVLPPKRRSAILLHAFSFDPKSALELLCFAGEEETVDEGIRLALTAGVVDGFAFERLGERATAPLVRHIESCGRTAEVARELERLLPVGRFAPIRRALGGMPSKLESLEEIVLAAQAATKGERTRVYVVRRADKTFRAREGSLSRAGGRAPGLAEAPTDSAGEPLVHVATIDLEDVPELRAAHPGARALAIFTADGEFEQMQDETVIFPISAEAAEAKPNIGHGAATLFVHGIDAPHEVFAEGPQSPAIESLRSAIRESDGHVLGRALWIQEPERGGGLLMQINDGVVPGLNLGDGALYVFGDHDAVFQC